MARVGLPNPQVPPGFAPTAEVVGTSVVVSWPEAQVDLRQPRRWWLVLREPMLERGVLCSDHGGLGLGLREPGGGAGLAGDFAMTEELLMSREAAASGGES